MALGAGSETLAVTPTPNATVNDITYGNFAGSAPKSAVSVGAKDSERQIQHVAAGRITADSTDAINGSQLYAVADKLATVDAAANRTNYFHVNTGAADQPVGNATTNEGTVDAKGGATGVRSLAAGLNAKAEGVSSISIGENAVNSQASANSIAIGRNAQNIGQAHKTITIGENATAENTNRAVVIGADAKATMHTPPNPTSGLPSVGGWQLLLDTKQKPTMTASPSVLEQKPPQTQLAPIQTMSWAGLLPWVERRKQQRTLPQLMVMVRLPTSLAPWRSVVALCQAAHGPVHLAPIQTQVESMQVPLVLDRKQVEIMQVLLAAHLEQLQALQVHLAT